MGFWCVNPTSIKKYLLKWLCIILDNSCTFWSLRGHLSCPLFVLRHYAKEIKDDCCSSCSDVFRLSLSFRAKFCTYIVKRCQSQFFGSVCIFLMVDIFDAWNNNNNYRHTRRTVTKTSKQTALITINCTRLYLDFQNQYLFIFIRF